MTPGTYTIHKFGEITLHRNEHGDIRASVDITNCENELPDDLFELGSAILINIDSLNNQLRLIRALK